MSIKRKELNNGIKNIVVTMNTINEIGLYFELYFKRIFSIKNILFILFFSVITMMIFMSFTMVMYWGDVFSLVDPFIVLISIIFIYVSIGKKKFHKKDKEYLFVQLIFFILLSFLLSFVIFIEVIFTNNFYDFTIKEKSINLFDYKGIYFIYENILLTLTIFFICSIINKLNNKEKNQVFIFMSFALLIFICVVLFGLYNGFKIFHTTKIKEIIKIQNITTTKGYLLLLPGNSFVWFFRILFYSNQANNYFQLENYGGYVGISQYVGLFVLTFINIVLFKYKESGA